MARAARPTSLPIAKLRALGCKVSTIIGHDPAIADYLYSVTLPQHLVEDEPYVAIGRAVVVIRDNGQRLIVKACSYRMGAPLPSRAESAANAADVAEMLTLIANQIESLNNQKEA